ncbi:hypothetical protein L21SP2_2150 [Salinispira pacifica]|uniref:Uncharacterized protein n=1 Tax=Salinispira pacifica TaxID=1307761 RepID=V5WI85_9SPIO|nr:hypothetical protein L21SP2_2150 [Salinispira pacifica]
MERPGSSPGIDGSSPGIDGKRRLNRREQAIESPGTGRSCH